MLIICFELEILWLGRGNDKNVIASSSFPPPPAPHIFPFQFPSQSQFQSHSQSVCLVSLCHLNLTCLLGVSLAVLHSLQSTVCSLQSSRQSAVFYSLHSALAVQSTKCIIASWMHLLCLSVSLSVSPSFPLPDQSSTPSIAYIRSISFSVACPASAAMFAFVYLKVS